MGEWVASDVGVVGWVGGYSWMSGWFRMWVWWGGSVGIVG